MPPVEIGTLIDRNPKGSNGRPIIAGTDVAVRRVVGLYRLGLKAEEIAKEIEHLTLAQVFAALACYHANRKLIDADIDSEEIEIERIDKERYLSKKR